MSISKSFYIRNFFLILGLIFATLLLNFQVISFNMMMFEQPCIYVANSHIHGLSDLLYQYLHPKFFQYSIPFFRPSGLFLMYYILAPLLGWHSTQAFFIVNLIILALCGWMIIKVYQALFPGSVIGGFIAYAIYLMHPNMMASKLTIIHFDYVYIFFILSSLYFFILFSKDNAQINRPIKIANLIFSLLMFAIGVTFKEAAIMTGPMLFAYFCIMHPRESFYRFLSNRDVIKVLLILTVVTLALFFYITSPWQGFFYNPVRGNFAPISLQDSFIAIVKGFFALKNSVNGAEVIMPMLATLVMFSGLLLTLALAVKKRLPYKQAIFLCCAGCLFSVLPLFWGTMPWHLSPSILFFSLLLGYSFEKSLQKFAWIAVLICLITPITNHINIVAYNGLLFKLNSNAIFHPPVPKEKIKETTIIVVEDSLIGSAYFVGNSRYPLISNITMLDDFKKNANDFLPLQKTYNGFLFPYAYLMPSLREEEYPFSVDKMQKVPDEIIYNWIQQRKDILCFGYDARGHWHDKTSLFQQNLHAEQIRRHMTVHSYQEVAQAYWKSNVLGKWYLPVEDPQLCQNQCDKRQECKGFVMLSAAPTLGIPSQCIAYSKISEQRPCPACTGFIKNVG